MALGDENLFHVLSETPDLVVGMATVDIGATGAPTVRTGSPVVNISRTGTGAYGVLTHLSPTGSPNQIFVFMAKTTTIYHVIQTGETNGGYTFETRNNAATPVVADPASGDVMCIVWFSARGRVR